MGDDDHKADFHPDHTNTYLNFRQHGLNTDSKKQQTDWNGDGKESSGVLIIQLHQASASKMSPWIIDDGGSVGIGDATRISYLFHYCTDSQANKWITTILKFDSNYHYNMVAPIFLFLSHNTVLDECKTAGGVPMAIQRSRKKSASNIMFHLFPLNASNSNSIMMMWMHALLAQPRVPRVCFR